MERMLKRLLAISAAGCLGMAGPVLAGNAPTSLSDAQMDQVVAGAIVSQMTTYQYYHGHSSNPAPGPGPGVTTYATTTTVYCPGQSTTCASPAQTTVVEGPTLVSGPGF